MSGANYRGKALHVRLGLGKLGDGRRDKLRAMAARRKCSVNDLLLRLIDEAWARSKQSGVETDGAEAIAAGLDDDVALAELIAKHGLEKALAIVAARAVAVTGSEAPTPPSAPPPLHGTAVHAGARTCRDCGERKELGVTGRCGPCWRAAHAAERGQDEGPTINEPPTQVGEEERRDG